MVSYYNPLSYSQKHSAANLAYPSGQHWQWPANYHTPPNHQFLGEMDSPHAHHQMYYNPMFHSAAPSTSTDWHSPASSAENFSSSQSIPSAHQMLQHQQQSHGGVGGIGSISGGGGGGGGGGGSTGTGSNLSSGSSSAASSGPGHTPLNETVSSLGDHHIAAEGLPSPPITVSGSEISSPGAPASSASPHHHGAHHLHNANNNNNNNNNSPTSANNGNGSSLNNNNNNNVINHNNNNRQASPVKSPYYDWMKKPSYPAQPTPGKTRTKDKYRVVYTDFQRLELEKEYCTSRYITIRRKTELAQTLSLSERQVKIWFQNRRAKERKQSKKGSDTGSLSIQQQHNEYVSLMDTKPKLEPGLHLQHSLHSMSSMAAMSMPGAIGLHHHHHHLHGHHHHALAAHTAAAAHHQSLHQSSHAQMSAAAAAAAASVSSLSM